MGGGKREINVKHYTTTCTARCLWEEQVQKELSQNSCSHAFLVSMGTTQMSNDCVHGSIHSLITRMCSNTMSNKYCNTHVHLGN